jgi:hypothetical protein
MPMFSLQRFLVNQGNEMAKGFYSSSRQYKKQQ